MVMMSVRVKLFKLRSNDYPSLESWLHRKGTHYLLSPCSQNEMLQMMSVAIQQDI